MIEINVIYGLILAILTLILSGGFLFSIRENGDNLVYALIPQNVLCIQKNILHVSRSTPLISEDIKPYSGYFLGFKLTIKRRQFLKALFLDFSPRHK